METEKSLKSKYYESTDADNGINDKQYRYDVVMMECAEAQAKLSLCTDKQVGCVVTQDNRIVATGFNGTPQGYNNDCEVFDEKCNRMITGPYTIHAEQNAIIMAARFGIPLDGTTMYVKYFPCPTCAKMIAQAGIDRVVFKEDFKGNEAMEFFKKLHIEVTKLEV